VASLTSDFDASVFAELPVGDDLLGVTLLWYSMHVEAAADCCAIRRVGDARMQSKSNGGFALIMPLFVS